MTGLSHSTLRTDVRALEATRTIDESIALLNGWSREYRGAVLEAFLFGRSPRQTDRTRSRKPSIATLVKRAEKTGKTVTSITTRDGTTINFGDPQPSKTNNPWLADIGKVTKQ
jgi:hypothetical protein